jgi:homoserine dehydrogenase
MRRTVSGTTVEVSLQVIRVGLLGFGGVGQAVARVATSASARLCEAGVLIKCVAALARDAGKPRVGPLVPLFTDPDTFPLTDCDIIVEVLGGIEPARTLVARALRLGIPVVTANKSLIAAHGLDLQALAHRHGTSLYFEAAVMAGVPCVNTLARRPLSSGTGAFAGILNGTSHFILSRMAKGETYGAALVEAVECGYAEPSSDADVSGRDAAEKLTILLHLAGYSDVRVSDLPTRAIDDLQPWHTAIAARLSGVIKPVALARCGGTHAGAWVGPAFVPNSHPFAALDAVANVLRVGEGAGAVTFAGPGAGREVTAATIIDDLVEVASGHRLAGRRPDAPPVAPALRQVPHGAWFLALDRVTTSVGDLAEFLAARHVPAVFVAAEPGRCAVLTTEAPIATLTDAVDALRAASVEVIWLPVLSGDAREREVVRG